MKTDWKALCQELLIDYEQHLYRSVLADRARAALAAEAAGEGPTLQLPEQAPDEHPPSNLDRREVAAWYHGHGCGWQAARAVLAAEADGPAVPENREPASVVGEPSDEELLDIAAQAIDGYSNGIKLWGYEAENEIAVEAYGSELITFARAVLARFSHQPAPPAEGEVGELVAWLQCVAEEVRTEDYATIHSPDLPARAADLLSQRHPASVPVSERPWEREDWCDDEDRCWCMSSLDGPPPRWWLVRPEPLSDGWVLPFTALPLPAGEVQA